MLIWDKVVTEKTSTAFTLCNYSIIFIFLVPYMPPKRQTGAGVLDTLKKGLKAAHAYVKQQKLVSKGLKHFGHNKLASHAALLGYGRPKKRRTRRM